MMEAIGILLIALALGLFFVPAILMAASMMFGDF